jgi:hypothetical protein
MAADGHVVINLSFDAGDAAKGINKITRAFDDMATEAEDAVDDVNRELDKMGSGADASGVEDELEDIGREADETSGKLRKLDKDKKKAVSPLKKVGDAFGGAFSTLADFSGGFLEGALSGAASGISALGDRVKSKFEGIKELVGHIGEKLLDVFIFDLMNQALDKTREKLGEIIAADTQLSNQINTIKGNISAAFAPLWNAVYPTVVKILNVVTAITSAIANLSAKVFGSAAVATDALKGEADAFGAVAEAAGSASQELGGFDEINTLPSSGGGGGGGGGAGGDLEDILATDLSTTFEDLYNRLMAINWEQVGQRISKALADIDFTKIGGKIAGVADYVMGAFRTVVEQIGWTEIGEDLAGGVDLIVAELPDLVATFTSWFNGVTEAFYGFVTEFDWAGFGKAIKDSFNTFFNSMDWKLVGLTISKFIIGIGTTITEAIRGIDKSAIYNAIKELIKGIDWLGIAEMIGKLLLVAFVDALEYLPAGLAIKAGNWLGITDFDPSEYIDEHIFGDTAEGMTETTTAGEKLGNTNAWLTGTFGDLQGATTEVGDAMGSTATNSDKAADAMHRVKAGTAALATSNKKTTTSVEKTTAAIEEENEVLEETDKSAATAILSNLSVAMSHENMVKTTSTGVITLDEALQNNLHGWQEYANKLTGIMNGISSKQTQFWSKMSNAATSAANTVKASFNTLPTHLSNAFTRAWQAIVSALTSDTGLKQFENGLEDVFKNSINELINGLNKVFDKLETQLNTTITTLKRTSVGGAKPFAGMQLVNLPAIPKLAKGSVIPGGHEFIALLGDQRPGQTNIEAPLDTIVEAMEISLQRNGSGNATAIASAVRAALAGMAVTFDGERVGRVVAAQIDANRRADGKFAYDLA